MATLGVIRAINTVKKNVSEKSATLVFVIIIVSFATMGWYTIKALSLSRTMDLALPHPMPRLIGLSNPLGCTEPILDLCLGCGVTCVQECFDVAIARGIAERPVNDAEKECGFTVAPLVQ